jgi:hypothetical protein
MTAGVVPCVLVSGGTAPCEPAAMCDSREGVIGERGHDDVSGFWIGVFHNAGKLLALAGIVKRKFELFFARFMPDDQRESG